MRLITLSCGYSGHEVRIVLAASRSAETVSTAYHRLQLSVLHFPRRRQGDVATGRKLAALDFVSGTLSWKCRCTGTIPWVANNGKQLRTCSCPVVHHYEKLYYLVEQRTTEGWQRTTLHAGRQSKSAWGCSTYSIAQVHNIHTA